MGRNHAALCPTPRLMWRLLCCLVWFALLGGCLDSPAAATRPVVEINPRRAALALRSASITVRLGQGMLDPTGVWLFQGELSDSQSSKLARGELSATLAMRRIAVTAWVAGDTTVIVPSVFLAAGERYSLAARDFGRLTEFSVGEDDVPALSRIWPPPLQAGAVFGVYCGWQLPHEPLDVPALPGPVALRFQPDFGELADGRACGTLTAGEDAASGPFLVPAPAELGFLFEPAPLLVGPSAAPQPAACLSDELPFGPGCIYAADDRALLRAGPEPQLFKVEASGGTQLSPLPAGGEYQLRGLVPDTEQTLSATAVSPSGVSVSWQTELRTQQRRAHLVLNEVLANPAGPEPVSEWVEILNDGTEPVSLDGFTLSDTAGEVALPPARLEAGEFALLVRSDFEQTASADVAVEAATKLILLPTLGGNGLSNSGELLTLREPSGAIASFFPALAARRAGFSVARRAPSVPDDDPTGFAEHGAPGASPGAPNRFDQ